jgi:hypothetical protein
MGVRGLLLDDDGAAAGGRDCLIQNIPILTYRLKTKLGVRVLVGRWIWVVVSEKVPHGSTS